MDLPEIKMVGLQTSKRLFQHLQSQSFISPMSADFGHQKHLFALSLKCAAQPNFALASMIFPAVVKEGYAAVDSFRDNTVGLLMVLGAPKMMTAQSERRNLDA